MRELIEDAVEPPTLVEDGWIALAPAHGLLWLLLLLEPVQALAFAFLPSRPLIAHQWVSWGFALLRWGLGGLAFAAALRGYSGERSGWCRTAAFGLGAASLVARVGVWILASVLFHGELRGLELYMAAHMALTLMGAGALVLLVVARDPEAGGAFDAAAAGLILAGGLSWFGLPVLAIAAMKGHPLLAAQVHALKDPRSALEGAWYDALDEGQRLRHLGAGALAFSLGFLMLLTLGLFVREMGLLGRLGWVLAESLCTGFAGLVLAIHVIRSARRAGLRPGRGMAVAAIWISGLPLLLLVAAIVVLILLLTGVIRFRLF
jgi:hypothetical protein